MWNTWLSSLPYTNATIYKFTVPKDGAYLIKLAFVVNTNSPSVDAYLSMTIKLNGNNFANNLQDGGGVYRASVNLHSKGTFSEGDVITVVMNTNSFSDLRLLLPQNSYVLYLG